jgi:class 3 adenylate cyclase
MEYRVLGSLEVLAASGEKLALGGVMQQSVLASLLLRREQTVALERLIDDLWDEPPETAARTVQAYVSRLRHELPKGAIESRPGGYRLVLDGSNFDLEAFEHRAEEGHRALATGQSEEARRLLCSALALWRGPALAGLSSDALRRQAERLEELRLTVLEDRLEADLRCARDAEIVPELKTLVAEHPFREHLHALLMRALYRSGRPGEALALYRETRRLLVDELGMEPGQELRELEQAILRQDTELEAPRRRRSTAPAPHVPVEPEPRIEQPAPREVRKTVTILFCDIVDSTARGESTDPEVMRSRLARFFEQMKTIVERHGGTVEKFIGDAVMAVFGVPRAHEDDALRACRAAIEMREALPLLGIEGRIGLMTGEVVTGTEERLATGDAVNVAARLEQAAGPGEVLIGKPTLELLHAAVEVEALEQLALKGKAQPVEAFRLNAVHEPVAPPAETPFVGREQELTAIKAAWERSLAERRCELVTIVGEAGVGKSRLAAEALASLDARVVEGRCLPYGDGITYWPVLEVIEQLEALPSDAVAASAIRSLLGETDTGTSPEEIAWAFRKLLEEQAPLIVVFDDIQWGEETFLDLLEHLGLLSAGSPILLLSLARPELTERRPAWPIALRLEPLPNGAVNELIGARVSAELRGRITRKAGGNPLFVSEMLAMTKLSADEVTVPPTLRALLAARLDQLDIAERAVLELGAIEGEVFHRGAIHALATEEPQVTSRLAALVRKGLIRTDAPQLAGEDGFRFRHILLRDAAYAGLAKATRADLHQRFADWLENRGTDLVELEEILGYHLEQAWRYREELGMADDTELAAAAQGRLTAAGRRAFSRQDWGAAANLLERAAALVPEGEVDSSLELNLTSALLWAGKAGESARRSHALAERAGAAGDRIGELCGRIMERIYGDILEPSEETAEQLTTLAGEALPLFKAAGDDLALHIAYRAHAWVADMQNRPDAELKAYEQAIVHARRAGFPVGVLLAFCGAARYHGGTPTSEVLAWQDEQEERDQRNPWLRSNRAAALAMLGRLDEARAVLADFQAELAERGGKMTRLYSAYAAKRVELLSGNAAAAAAAGEEHYRLLEELGLPSYLPSVAAGVARAYCELGRLEDATAWASRAADLGASNDAYTQTVWRQVRARVLAHGGEHVEAERLAREAVAIADETDSLNVQGDAYADLAEVLEVGDRPGDAAEALAEALARYERKENLVMAERVRARLKELGSRSRHVGGVVLDKS